MGDMGRAKQIPSAEAHVVKIAPARAKAARGALAALGRMDELPGSDLVVVRLAGAGADPKAAWHRILGGVPSVAWAAPLLRDEEGQEHFPTGDVTVRFEHAPSAAALEQFARAHGLRIRGRNEFIAEQVVFTPAQPRRTYLPELVQSLGGADGVASAWANTLSRYRRVEGRR
jgi:hypothetical protein